MSGSTSSNRLTPVDDTDEQTVYYDDARDTYHMWCDDSEYEPVTTALPLAVSSIHGVDPAELEPLAECIDPDALNTLVVDWCNTEPRFDERVESISFLFSQCSVTIHGDGEIVIDPDRADPVA